MKNWRDYGSMSREELIERLRKAEDVCVYTGWSASLDGSDRGDAATELWMRWVRQPGVSGEVEDNTELASAEKSLAAARRATRGAVLAKIRGV